MGVDPSLSESWLHMADRDLRAARWLLAAVPPLCTGAAFHSQQAAEKALKGFLEAHDADPIRTHDVEQLLGACVARDGRFAQLAGVGHELTPFAVTARYDDIEADHARAAAALEGAERIVAMVRAALASNG